MKNRFTPKAEHALEGALEAARNFGHTYIGSEHLLLALAGEQDSVAAKLLSGRGATADLLRKAIGDALGIGSRSAISPADMTPRTRRIIEAAAVEASANGASYIGTEYLLAALLSARDCAALRILTAMRISISDLQTDLQNYFGTAVRSEDGTKAVEESKRLQRKEVLSAMPALQAHGRDLTRLAKEGKLDPIIGRDAETERVIQTLSRRTKNNPCLIGEPGVGKTAVIEGLAQRIAAGFVPQQLRDRVIVTLDIPSMIAGAKYRGEFEERLKHVMEEVARNPRIILFVDEIHTIIGAGGAEGAIDAANIIKPALARGEMQLIGATTIAEYRRHIEKDAALERRFQPIQVGEPSEEETLAILRGLREKFELHHQLRISDEALEAAVRLSVRYIPDRFLPDKAIDLLDEAAAHQRLVAYTTPPALRELEAKLQHISAEKETAVIEQDFERAAHLRDEEFACRESYRAALETWKSHEGESGIIVNGAHIAEIVTQWTMIPVHRLLEEESARLLALEDELGRRVIGQARAISAVARAIRRGRTGIKDPRRPIGSFLFLGPTGVGKTELSIALAEALFGSTSALIRLDMSEYMEKHSVSKLIGSPPGYVGYEEGGQLTERIRRRPYAVVLFDEIEKAHPDIFHLLLQILEDGRLTDAQGRHVDFRNTVIILTSNLGSTPGEESRTVGFGNTDTASAEARDEKAVQNAFRPELINRIDDIIRFSSLQKDEIASITRLMLNELSARIAQNGIQLSFEESVVDWLAQEGHSPRYGARPLRRMIVRYVEDPLSMALLEGRVRVGDKIIASHKDDGNDGEKIIFTPSSGSFFGENQKI
ncbi:MAG: ATP-dependent Clp protease ATP-binding subunit [Clostridia bacterium]|nr:ATP-dependent Clp protease ATP-binding subunit [Clostridia bacterium]